MVRPHERRESGNREKMSEHTEEHDLKNVMVVASVIGGVVLLLGLLGIWNTLN